MLNLKEPCKNCQSIDYCIKAVRNTIDNIPTGRGRDAFDCVHFANFEYAFMQCVFDGISKALKNYKGEYKMTDYLTDAHSDVKTYFATHEIPIYFYQCFFGEIVKVWGMKFLIPDRNYDAEYDDEGNIIPSKKDGYSYKDQIDFFLTCEGGTAGWNLAFKEACTQCNLMQLYEDYLHMDWVRGDYFDGCLADRMLDALFAEDATSDYYFFKFNKENNDE